eukprot:s1816_g4.t1
MDAAPGGDPAASSLKFRVNALEQQAELADLKKQLDAATTLGQRQEQRLRQHRTSVRDLSHQLEELEQRVDGVQKRVENVSRSISRSAEAVGVQEKRGQQLDQLANSSSLKRGAASALSHGSPNSTRVSNSRADVKIEDKLEELERRLWQATQEFDRRLTEEPHNNCPKSPKVEGRALPMSSASSDSASVPFTTVAPSNHHGEGHGDHSHVHIHGPLDRDKALGIGSLSFEPIFNERYNKDRVAQETKGFLFLQRTLPIMIGLLTAGTAWVVGQASEFLGSKRTEIVNQTIVERGWFWAWCAEFSLMAILALVGGFFVYCGDISGTKTAGSSGIPQLIGLLNGCDLKGEFTFRHLLVKWFGVCLAVASGLAVGPEGPMIFIGASIGYLFSRLPQNPTVWRLLGTPPATVGDDVFTRDYTSIGAACGIAAAFRAPIAGTLFIVEEAASHFKKEQMSNIFFGGLAALEVILLTGGAGAVLEYKVQVGPGCSDTPYWTILFCVVIGLLCGVVGAAFNALNIQVMVWRSRYCSAARPARRAMEILILCLLSSTAWLGVATLFGEREAAWLCTAGAQSMAQSNGCIKDDYRNQIINGSVIERQGRVHVQRYFPAPCLYGVQYGKMCNEVHALAPSNPFAKTCVKAVTTPDMQKLTDFQDYCCSFSSLDDLKAGSFSVPGNASCPIDLGEFAPSLKKGQETSGLSESPDEHSSFNSVGLLSLVPFKTACQNLFARGMPNLVTIEAMAAFLVLFFVLAAITAGSAIPSGTLMPQMVIGGLIGRILAVVLLNIQSATMPGTGTSWAQPYTVLFGSGGVFPDGSPVTLEPNGFLDPGIAALMGAAAFLGGSGRVTLFTTVMMVEITGDPVMIFPVGFSTVFAVLVGNLINHGLYHSLIDVQSTPYLPDTWQADQLPPGIVVRDMMPKNKPIEIKLAGGREGIKDALKGNNFSGFPVVDAKRVVVGMVDRKDLEELLDQDDEITAEDLKRCSSLYPVTVRESFPLQSAYQLFKSMDMKNLVVVDDNHTPLAVMTRFAFLAWRVADRMGGRIHELHERELQRRRSRRRSLAFAACQILEAGSRLNVICPRIRPFTG